MLSMQGREFKPRLEHYSARVTQWLEWGSYAFSPFLHIPTISLGTVLLLWNHFVLFMPSIQFLHHL